MKRTTNEADADLAAKIQLKIEELGWTHPDRDACIMQLVYDYFHPKKLDYEIVDPDDPCLEEAFPD